MVTKMFVAALAALTLWQGAVVAGEPSLFHAVLEDALNKTQSPGAQDAARAAGLQLHALAHHLVMGGESALIGSLEALQGLADSLGQVLGGDCVAGRRTEAAHVFAAAQSAVLRCLTDRVAEVGLLLEDVAGLAARATLLPHEAAANVTACFLGPPTAVFCAAEVVGAWGYASEAIVDGVTADLDRGQRLFDAAPGEIAACAAAQVDAAAEGAQRINVSIAQCVVDGAEGGTTANSAY